MTTSSFATLFALLAFVGWGIGDTVGIKLFRHNDPGLVTFMSGLYRLAIWLLLLPLFWSGAGNITLSPLIYNLLAGLSSGLGYYFFGKAAKTVNPAIVTAVSGGWGASVLLLSLIFFKDTLTVSQWLSAIVVFFGLILVTYNSNWFKGAEIKKNRGYWYALLTLLLWGLCGAFLKIPSVAYGWYWTSVIMLVPYFLLIILFEKTTLVKTKLRIKNWWLFLLMVGLIMVADLGYNNSFQLGGSAAIVGTIGGSYAVLSTLLAYFIYREPLGIRQKIGIVISLIGIMATSYFSSI